MVRNTEELISALSQAIEAKADSTLREISIAPAQILSDLGRQAELIHTCQPDQFNRVSYSLGVV